jgi:methylase of polypeptide subunit release factors
MNKNLKANRPDIITTPIETINFYRKMDTAATVVEMIEGKYVLVEEFYSNGLQVLAELRKNLLLKHQDKTPQGQRDYRNAFKKASQRLVLKIQENKLLVKKSPDIGWLEILYPDVSEFYISFSEVQDMSSSWQSYKKGIEVKTLNLNIHPYYGTYFPTKFDHLKLFDKFLNKYSGKKNNAIDIGTGSGVLSFQLIKNGFENIFASDINPNSIISVREDSKLLGYENKIKLNHGDLFENCDIKSDLIVFNPPWLIAKHKLEDAIDRSMYYDEDIFSRFFEQAQNHLSSDGKIVIIFSNQVEVDDDKTHPIINELQKNNRFRKELHLRRDIRASSRRTKRRDSKDNEKVELWVLSLK